MAHTWIASLYRALSGCSEPSKVTLSFSLQFMIQGCCAQYAIEPVLATVPPDSGTSPRIPCNRVDFPDPTGPTTATSSPLAIVILASDIEGSGGGNFSYAASSSICFFFSSALSFLDFLGGRFFRPPFEPSLPEAFLAFFGWYAGRSQVKLADLISIEFFLESSMESERRLVLDSELSSS